MTKRLLALVPLTLAMLGAATDRAYATPVKLTCDAGPPAEGREVANLHGNWDFLMAARGQASFGTMSIGFVGAEYGGMLAPTRTAPVVIRTITLTGNAIRMIVATRESDVVFEGHVSAKGDFLCGTVTYHGGEVFPMIAHKRPMTYQSPPVSERR